MSTGAYPGPRPDRASAQQARAAALSRLTRVRGLTIVAAGALTAAVAGVVSAASGRTLGHHVVRTAAVTPRAATTSSAKLPPLASARALGLGRPSHAPQPQDQGGSTTPQSQPQPAPAPAPVAPQPVQPQTVAPQTAAPGPAVSGGS